ncbi:hypothetical protein [Novosphingobium barchaimii]|nr:hypothetical protein [Novosphingobium barchaimii]
MRIAAHHIPGTSENRLSSMLHSNPDYTPTCAWPEDCTVQWGHGIIPAVPFFEAFPTGTFIRGEGATIAEAEQKAFEKYQRDRACDHLWGRHRPNHSTYTNGAAFCRKCGGFRGSMFREVVILGHWRTPLSRWESDWLAELEGPRDPDFEVHMERKYPGHAESCRKSRRLLRIRKNLFGVEEARIFP